MTSKILTKLLSILLFICIVLAILLIQLNPVSEYELSIYDSLFPLGIILIVAPIIGGIGLVVHGLFRRNNQWQIGLLLIVLSSLIIVFLPYLKGYAFSDGGDHLFHLGYVKNILNTTQININDVYPVIHILIVQSSLITNISPEIMINFIGPLYYILFILFTYLCASEILSRKAAVLAAVASTVLFCYYYNEIFPMGFAFITFPFVFYLHFKNLNNRSYAVIFLLVVIIVLMIIFHPVASFMLTAALFLMEIGNLVYQRFFINRKDTNSINLKQAAPFSLNFPMISMFGLTLWIWYRYDVWNSAVSSVANWFSAQLFVQPMTAAAQENFNKLGLNLMDQFILFERLYGHTFIYLALTVITTFLIFKNLKQKVDNNREIFSYSCVFLPAVGIWLIDYVRPLSILSSGRMITLVTAMFPVLVGVTLDRGIDSYRSRDLPHRASFLKSTGTIAVGIVLSICSLIAIFALYPSPQTYKPYWGISYASFNGEAWLVKNGNPDLNMLSLSATSPNSIAAALWGTGEGEFLRANNPGIDFHFGYDLHQTLGESYAQDKYLFLVTSDKLLYTELWPEVGRLNLTDFAKLENDYSIYNIYSNGESQDYYVRGIAVP